MRAANTKKLTIKACDLFAAVGSSALGVGMAGAEVVAAVDNWDLARTKYVDNFKGVAYYRDRRETLGQCR